MSLIPKNIYKTAPYLHQKLKKLYLNTEIQNPGWKIKFYNDKDCIKFLENEFSKDNLDLRKNVSRIRTPNHILAKNSFPHSSHLYSYF